MWFNYINWLKKEREEEIEAKIIKKDPKMKYSKISWYDKYKK